MSKYMFKIIKLIQKNSYCNKQWNILKMEYMRIEEQKILLHLVLVFSWLHEMDSVRGGTR